MEAIQKKLAFQFLGNRFFIMGQIGGILLLLTCTAPAFWLYWALGAVGLGATILWDGWRGMSKSVRYGVSILMIAMCLFLIANSVARFWMPPAAGYAAAGMMTFLGGLGTADPVAISGGLAHFTQSAAMAAIQMVSGAVANVFFLIGGTMGILAAREME